MSAKPHKSLANKSGEPEFQLKTDPESELIFKNDDLDKKVCLIKLRIDNTTNERQIYKIKCTSNEIFRVRPPLGYIPPNSSQVVQIAFVCKTVPESYKHFFAFYHAKCSDTRPPKKVWVGNFDYQGVKRMWCLFQKEDGSDFVLAPTNTTQDKKIINNSKDENNKVQGNESAENKKEEKKDEKSKK
uniref:Major sperm protein n=1 Tax=Strongyloides stercoralis TaxID=6248 RepID=A0A0K0DVJ0_STRER